MKLFSKQILLTLFSYFMVTGLFAQSRFYTSVSANQVAKDEYIAFRIIVEEAEKIESIHPPSLQSFKILSGPLQETGVTDINGKVTHYISYTYLIQPKRTGKFTIGKATAKIDGKSFTSPPISLIVGQPEQPQQPQVNYKDLVVMNGEKVADKVAKNMQLRLQTDRTSCYVGEPIVATYKLYTRLKNESRLAKNPSFNGFSVIDMPRPDNNIYNKEMLDGREYNMLVIRKAQLYPLQSGQIELETAEVDNNLLFLRDAGNANASNAEDLVNGGMVDPSLLISDTATISSKPITITVKPLPETGKPASFKGAVGEFHLESALVKNTFTTDETGTLAIRISGAGNLKLVTAPDIDWPSGLDPFEPKLTENMSYQTIPVSGDKTFTYSFSVQKEGDYAIPAISFSYFDPETGTYKKDSTKPLSFSVTKGTGAPVYKQTDLPKKEKVSFLNSIFVHRWWIIVFVAIVIFLGLYYWLKHETKKEKLAEKIKKEEEEKAATDLVVEVSAINQKNPLEESETCLYSESCLQFYVILNKEMKSFIATRFKLESSQINSKTIATAMDNSGIANETVLQLQQLMQEIEWYLYTPFVENEKRNELYSRSHDIIQQLAVVS